MTTRQTLHPTTVISGGFPATKKGPTASAGIIAAIIDNDDATWDYRTTESPNQFVFQTADSPGDPAQLVQWRCFIKDIRSTNGRHYVQGILTGTGQGGVQASTLSLQGGQAAATFHPGPWVPGAGINPDRMLWVDVSAPLSSGAAYATDPKVKLIEAWLEADYAIQPSVTVTGPVGNIEDSRPDVTWGYTSNEADAQTGCAWALYHLADATAAGFTPVNPREGDPMGNGAVAWHTGAGADQSDPIPEGLVGFTDVNETGVNGVNTIGSQTAGTPLGSLSGGSYRIFVWAQERVASFTNKSNAAFSDFAVVNDPPPPPLLQVGWIPEQQAIELVALGHMNLVPHPWDNNEASDPGWAFTGGTGGRIASVALEGAFAQRVQSTAGGTVTGATAHLSIVSEGVAYRWAMIFAAAPSARVLTPLVDWYTAADVFISTSTGTPTALSTVGTTSVSVADTSPAGAAKARFRFSIAATAAAEQFTFDELQLTPGLAGPTPWSPVGVNPRMQMERSLDLGVTWYRVRRLFGEAINPVDDSVIVDLEIQQYRVLDFEAPRGKPIQYRARELCETSAGVTVSSDWYIFPLVTVPSDGQAWLKCVTDPTLNAGGVYVVKGSTQTNVQIDKGDFYPLGLEGVGVSIVGAVHGQDGSFDVRATTQQEYEQLVGLVTSGEILLYQEAHKQTDGSYPQRYISVKPPAWAGRRAVTGLFTVSFVENAMPA